MTEYKFRILKSEQTDILNESERNLIIQTFVVNSTIKIILKMHIDSELKAKSILVLDDKYEYLAGFFEMDSRNDLENSLKFLVEMINSPDIIKNSFTSLKWEKFNVSFRNWFVGSVKDKLIKVHSINQTIYEE